MALKKPTSTEVCNSEADNAEKRRIAEIILSPAATHSTVARSYLNALVDGKLDQETMRQVIRDKSREIVGGDLSGAERMLFSQATTLNAVCVDLLLRANANLYDHISHGETYMKLALKAQSQCRATLETLAAIKNPPIFARQANFANGPQQVNNGVPARAGENQTAPNELLEVQNEGERLDVGTPGQASGGAPALAAVGAIDGTANGKRQSRR